MFTKYRWLVTSGILIGLLVFISLISVQNPGGQQFPSSVTTRDLQLAREAFELKYGRRPDRLDLLSWLAEWKAARKLPLEAIECFQRIPSAHPLYGPMARYQQGRILLNLHRAVEAEHQLREFLSLNIASIDHKYIVDARQCLRHILEVELRLEERHQLLQGVIDRAEDDTFEAVGGCFPNLLRWNGPEAIGWLEEFRANSPPDPFIEIAFGRYRTAQGRPQEARPVLDAVLRQQPENRYAIAALISCLKECGELDRAQELLRSLPAATPEDPWLLSLQRGTFALEEGRGRDAVAAFQQVIDQNRTCSEAWQGMSAAARLLEDEKTRTKAVQMIADLGRIQNHLGKGIQDSTNPNSFLDIADLCLEIPLIREGAVMARWAFRLAPDDPRVRSTVQLFRQRLAADHLPPLLD